MISNWGLTKSWERRRESGRKEMSYFDTSMRIDLNRRRAVKREARMVKHYLSMQTRAQLICRQTWYQMWWTHVKSHKIWPLIYQARRMQFYSPLLRKKLTSKWPLSKTCKFLTRRSPKWEATMLHWSNSTTRKYSNSKIRGKMQLCKWTQLRTTL